MSESPNSAGQEKETQRQTQKPSAICMSAQGRKKQRDLNSSLMCSQILIVQQELMMPTSSNSKTQELEA